jgi:hypothetical protein
MSWFLKPLLSNSTCTATTWHGKGRQTFGGRIDGRGADVYEGDWAEGARCGEGTMQYASGDVFQGCWVGDHKHGEGTYFYEVGLCTLNQVDP